MALQLGALREALLHPGDPDLATKAAEELAGDESRLGGIETKLAVLVALVSAVTALALGNLWMAFTILSLAPAMTDLATKADVEALRIGTRSDLAELKADLIKWNVGALAVLTGIFSAIVRLG